MGEMQPPSPVHITPFVAGKEDARAELLRNLVTRLWPRAASGREVAGLPPAVAALIRPNAAGRVIRKVAAELDRAMPGWVEVAVEIITTAEITPLIQQLCTLVAQRPVHNPNQLLHYLIFLPNSPEPQFWVLVALSGTDTAAVRTVWRDELYRCSNQPAMAGTRAAWFCFVWSLVREWITWPEFRDCLTAGQVLRAVDPRGEYRPALECLQLWSHPTFAKWYRQVVYEVSAQPDVTLSFPTSGWVRDFPGKEYLFDALARLQEGTDSWWPYYIIRWTSQLPADDPAFIEELHRYSPTALCLLSLLRPELAEAVAAVYQDEQYAAVIHWLLQATPATPFDLEWCRLVLAPWAKEHYDVITVATGALCSLMPPLDYVPPDTEAPARRTFIHEHLRLNLELLMDNFLFVLALNEEHFPFVIEEARRGRISAIRALALRPEMAEQTVPLLFSLLRRGKRPRRAMAHETLVHLAKQAGLDDLRLLEQRMDLASAWADGSAGGTLGRVWWNIAGYHLRLSVQHGKVRQLVYTGERALRSVPTEVRKDPSYKTIQQAREELSRRYRYLRGRLEQVMEEGVPYQGKDFAILLSSPAARSLVSRVVLRVDDNDFLWSPADPLLETEVPSEIASANLVTVAHPVLLHHAGTLEAWQMRLVAEGFTQPFKQLFREIYPMNEHECESMTCERFAGCPLHARRAFALLRQRGYAPRQGVAMKAWPLAGVRAHLRWAQDHEPSGKLLAQHNPSAPVTFGSIWFENDDQSSLPLGAVPPIVLSETLRDADLTVSLAPYGEAGFTSEETRRLRALLVRHLTRAMGLTTVYVSDDHSHILIEGSRALYRLHLGSGSVLLEHSRRHVDVSGIAREAVPQAFVESLDSFTTHIVRTVLALCRDAEITNPQFLQQINP